MKNIASIEQIQPQPIVIEMESPTQIGNERREYTYSLRVVLDIKPPWNLASMNDLFQDARLLAHTQSNYQKVEVTVYPYASPVLLPTRNPSQIASGSLKKYIQPRVT